MLENIKRKWDTIKLSEKESMHLYLHAPFCLGVCKYCMYKSIDMRSVSKEIYTRYFEGLLNQIRDFEGIIKSKQPDSLYFGGGTPSIIPFNILKDIAKAIPDFDKIRIKVFEANPASTSREKIDILSQLGFTYLALGVQTLDNSELIKQSRQIPKDGHLKDITQYALSKGIHVNYDLMTLLNDNLEEDMGRVYKDLKMIMDYYKPPSIDIYPMDQKLNNISPHDILKKIKALRRTIAKAVYLNEDYHVAGGMEKVNLMDDSSILNNYKGNYHVLNIPDEVYFGERKAYSCSGPLIAPRTQNVISFGGFGDLWSYSYSADKSFIYYTKIDKHGNVLYKVDKGEV